MNNMKNLLRSITSNLVLVLLSSYSLCLAQEIPRNQTGLVMPVKTSITVNTSHGSLTCKPGSLVFFIDNKKDVAYFNVNAQHRGDVKVALGKFDISVLPGEEVLITTEKTGEFEAINPGKGISFRKPELEHESEEYRIFTADFSIPSAIMAVKPLKDMLKSKDPYARHLITEVLKNAVIWNETAAADGVYKQGK